MNSIELAVQILREGRLVAFPTETVYGLGADATNAEAVKKIFAAKGRPATNPVIVHVADIESAKRYTTQWTDAAELLANTFWPGPLTLVLPKTPEIPDIVTAGLPTVGLRVPNHPVALNLLRAFGGPIAAPSANRSNRISPTTQHHVIQEFSSEIELLMEGGASEIGIESTVLDLSGDVPRILRPGAVTIEQIVRVIGNVASGHRVTEVTLPALAPGQHSVHYAPRTPAFRFEKVPTDFDRKRDGMIVFGTLPDKAIRTGYSVEMPRDPVHYAKHLYEKMRELDWMKPTRIFIEMPPDQPEWAAVRDRLLRATRELD